jgi:hypothetical protein
MIFEIDIDKAEEFFIETVDCEKCILWDRCSTEMKMDEEPQPTRACTLFILRCLTKKGF